MGCFGGSPGAANRTEVSMTMQGLMFCLMTGEPGLLGAARPRGGKADALPMLRSLWMHGAAWRAVAAAVGVYVFAAAASCTVHS